MRNAIPEKDNMCEMHWGLMKDKYLLLKESEDEDDVELTKKLLKKYPSLKNAKKAVKKVVKKTEKK